MVRVKRGNVAKKRRKKVLRYTKGFKSSNSRLFRIANQQYIKGLKNSYIGRKLRKRFFRTLWIIRINSVSRQNKTTYSLVVSYLKKNKIALNRKVLSILLTYSPIFFKKIIQ